MGVVLVRQALRCECQVSLVQLKTHESWPGPTFPPTPNNPTSQQRLHSTPRPILAPILSPLLKLTKSHGYSNV